MIMEILILLHNLLLGWPPSKTRNMTVYLKPNQNTTVIMPRILREAKLQNITYDDRQYNKTFIYLNCFIPGDISAPKVVICVSFRLSGVEL